jgi:hypothetical protein
MIEITGYDQQQYGGNFDDTNDNTKCFHMTSTTRTIFARVGNKLGGRIHD